MNFNVNKLSNHWPLIIAIILLWITIYSLFKASVGMNNGIFIYVLDDPYVHMAMAKNFILHGVLGVDQYSFTSSSSSPLWLLLLSSMYLLFGINDLLPLILNIIFATITVLVAYFILNYYKLSSFYNLIFLLLFIFLTPIPAVVFTGMEHNLQMVLTISFAFIAAIMLSKEEYGGLKLYLLIILAFFSVAVRYENIFIVFVVAILFIIRKRSLNSLSLLSAGFIPVLVYGIYSTLNGWFFLPNSLVTKSTFVEDKIQIFSLEGIFRFWDNFKSIMGIHIFIPVALALGILIYRLDKQKNFWNGPNLLIIIFLGSTFLHMLLARVGWFYRYEAYLLALGILAIAIGIADYLPSMPKLDRNQLTRQLAIILLIFMLFFPIADRGYFSVRDTPKASHNIYDQQYQMALFVKEYYSGSAVAINDVGTVNYYANIKSVDLLGLSGLETSKYILKGNYSIQDMDNLTKQKNVKVAIIYEDLFKDYLTGGVPSSWIKVGEWKISNKITPFMDTVSFYAVDPNEKDNLIKNLREFSHKLPDDVKQNGTYMENGT
ncbi:MAG: hypothetical protein ACXVHT_00825 [Methanobacterium sp.]